MSCYIHDVPGRLRVKAPKVKDNAATAARVEGLLGTIPGIHSVNTNTLTGSVLVNYNPASMDSKRVLDILERNGYFDASKVPGPEANRNFDLNLTKTGRVVGKALLGLAIEAVFEGTPLSLLSVLI